MSTQTKTLKLYSPHEMQRRFHESKARYRVAVWGRQSGKSTASINEIIRQAWEHPGHVYWFISPTYKQARVIFRRMRRALRHLPENEVSFNKSELSVEFSNGALIACQSGKEYDNLRTETLNGAVIDEMRYQHPSLWKMVISPMLRTTKGWAVFVSTPAGFDAFYELAERAKANNNGKWEFFAAPSTCNPLFTKDEFEEARSEMSEPEFAQEILAEFRDIFSGKAYKSHGEWNQRISSPFAFDGGLLSPYLPVTVGLDFNVTPMSWHLGQFRNQESYWFDEIHIGDTNTTECAQELVGRLLAIKEKGLLRAQPNVRLCGDATGESRNTKATESDYSIITNALDAAGITWNNETPASNPPVKTRVNTMNARLKAADGTVSLWYHPVNCPMLKKDFERVAWKKGAEHMLDQKSDPSLTHATDSVGYPVCAFAPIEGGNQVGTLRVIRR